MNSSSDVKMIKPSQLIIYGSGDQAWSDFHKYYKEKDVCRLPGMCVVAPPVHNTTLEFHQVFCQNQCRLSALESPLAAHEVSAGVSCLLSGKKQNHLWRMGCKRNTHNKSDMKFNSWNNQGFGDGIEMGLSFYEFFLGEWGSSVEPNFQQ